MALPGIDPPLFVAVGGADAINRLLPTTPLENELSKLRRVTIDALAHLGYLAACEASNEQLVAWAQQAEAAKEIWRKTARAMVQVVATECAEFTEQHESGDHLEVGAEIRAHYGLL